MEVTLDTNIVFTLQLIDNAMAPVTDATISYVIMDSSGTVEIVSSQTAIYNTTTESYVDELDVETEWASQTIGSYLVVWTLADVTNDFPTKLTEDLHVNMDESKIDRILGLVHENIYIDNTTFDNQGNMLTARLRTYSVSTSVGTDNDVLNTYEITADATGPGQFASWKQVES